MSKVNHSWAVICNCNGVIEGNNFKSVFLVDGSTFSISHWVAGPRTHWLFIVYCVSVVEEDFDSDWQFV